MSLTTLYYRQGGCLLEGKLLVDHSLFNVLYIELN